MTKVVAHIIQAVSPESTQSLPLPRRVFVLAASVMRDWRASEATPIIVAAAAAAIGVYDFTRLIGRFLSPSAWRLTSYARPYARPPAIIWCPLKIERARRRLRNEREKDRKDTRFSIDFARFYIDLYEFSEFTESETYVEKNLVCVSGRGSSIRASTVCVC